MYIAIISAHRGHEFKREQERIYGRKMEGQNVVIIIFKIKILLKIIKSISSISFKSAMSEKHMQIVVQNRCCYKMCHENFQSFAL